MELWYAIVDLLPFEWAESGSMYFMKNALLAVLVISPLFGILSTMVVQSRMSFFSDALGHSAFTGMAIGALCGFAEPTWAAVVFAVVFAVLFNVVRRRTAMASDTVIGVFSSTAVALGIFISTLGSRSFTKFNSLLIGDILSVEPSKIGVLALILLLVCALWGLSFNQLMLSAVHPALADSRGVRVFWQETIFSVAIAVVVTLSMTWVGLLVINSLLILPGAISVYNAIIAKTAIEGIPDSLEESAKLDGCGFFKIYTKIMMPLSKPVIAVVGLYTAVNHWNDWFSGAFYMSDTSKWPVQTVLQNMLTKAMNAQQNVETVAQALAQNAATTTSDSLKMAAVVVTTVPILCVYPFIQKYFAQGSMIGAVKE